MGREIDLLRSLPVTSRSARHGAGSPDPEDVRIARLYGRDYFDGDRRHGYGGYRYDGRWVPVAADIVKHFGLSIRARVLDIGCAKGFLVEDLFAHESSNCWALEPFGLDISEYAVRNCHPNAVGRLHLGSAHRLPFPDKSFDAVVSINTLHNLEPDECIVALQEITRVCRDPTKAFVQVDSYRTKEEVVRFHSWVLTAKTHGPPEFWINMFELGDYQGDYAWMIN